MASSPNVDGTERVRPAVHRGFARTGRAPGVPELSAPTALGPDRVRRGLRTLHARHGLVLDPHDEDRIVTAHPSASVPLGFSVTGTRSLGWGGCARDSFALPHLLGEEPGVLVATRCPACDAPHAWVVGREAPPGGRAGGPVRRRRRRGGAGADAGVRAYAEAMAMVRVEGVEVVHDRVGEGPPLVFLHGAASDARLWWPQLDALADAFTVVAWDEPGAGRSSDLPESYGLADYAHCLAAVVESLRLGPAHVAGLSWGGTLALEFYRHHADLVRTLILADTYAGWKGSLPAEEVRARVEGARRMLAVPPDAFDPTLPGLFAGERPATYLPLLGAMGAAVRPDTLRRQLSLMAEADQRDLLPAVSVPTLLVWGEQDARSPLTVARQFQESVPGAELVVIPGAGHVSNLERPEEFNRAVRDFCRAHAPV
ncbi:alpha/beta fold hydrolase [Streptomyces omiyaensis]|uniref:Alpha/beta fold hydrolase n=1 Tax=Streptomyces omiyaensis TaxID=68247 RepID=A0ABW7BPB5_9ACTN